MDRPWKKFAAMEYRMGLPQRNQALHKPQEL